MKNSLKTIINGLKTWVIDRLDFNKLKNRPFYEDVENNVIVPMDKKFLPEHQHPWESLEDKPFYNYEEVLFEADSVTSEYHTWEMGTYKFIPLLDFKLGETIFVNLDSTTYEKTVVEVVEQSSGTTYIGLDFTSDFKFNQCGIFSDNLNIDLENAYVKIYRKNLKQIDEKFIPDSIARTEDIPMGGGVEVTYDEEKEAIIFGASSGSSSGGSDEPYELIANIEITEDGVTSIEQDLGKYYKKVLLTSVNVLDETVTDWTSHVRAPITTEKGIKILGFDKSFLLNEKNPAMFSVNFEGLNCTANRLYFFELEYKNNVWKAQATQQFASGGTQMASSTSLFDGFALTRKYINYIDKIQITGTFANGCKLYLFGIKA